MVESARFENVCAGNGTVGSNPTSSAKFYIQQHLSISQKVKIGGVFWTKFEHFLSKTPNKEASPAVARKPRHPAQKFSFNFLTPARQIFLKRI